MEGQLRVTIAIVLMSIFSGACGGSDARQTTHLPRQKSPPGTVECWEYMGEPGFSRGAAHSISLAVLDAIPYVAFIDKGTDNGLVVMKFESGKWVSAGDAIAGGSSSTPSLAFHNDIPYVAYVTQETIRVIRLFKGHWEGVGRKEFLAEKSDIPALRIAEGSIYIAFRDSINPSAYNGNSEISGSGNGTSPGITVMRLRANEWELVGERKFSDGFVYEIALAINKETPYVAFNSGSHGHRISVMTYSGQKWELVGRRGFSDGSVLYISCDFVNDELFVAFQDSGKGNRARVMRYSASGWEDVGQKPFSDSIANFVSVTFDRGMPYCAFSDSTYGYRATVVAYDGNRLSFVGSPGFTRAGQGYTRIIAADGTLYVAFSDGAENGRITVMRCSNRADMKAGD